jgi:hypothetical protein
MKVEDAEGNEVKEDVVVIAIVIVVTVVIV